MLAQLIQIGGAVCILTAFLLLQANIVSAKSRWYLWLNLIGSLILAANAYTGQQWGFLLLQTVWATVSALSLISLSRRNKRPVRH